VFGKEDGSLATVGWLSRNKTTQHSIAHQTIVAFREMGFLDNFIETKVGLVVHSPAVGAEGKE
jgi:hypothetical protein